MNFGFTDEQELLRSDVRKFLDESCPLEQVRKITENVSGPGFSPVSVRLLPAARPASRTPSGPGAPSSSSNATVPIAEPSASAGK